MLKCFFFRTICNSEILEKYLKKNGNNKFVIYSDSLSAIQSIKSNRNQTSLNIRISDILNKIKKKTIVFEWIPSHVNIAGNELADIGAKEATFTDCLLAPKNLMVLSKRK